MMDIKAKDDKYVANTYRRFPLTLVSGKGSEFRDDKGKTYIDMGSGIGVTCFGAGDEEWKKAVTAQLDKIQHTSNLYYSEPCANLAELLCNKTGFKKVFFSNSGAEANECGIKVARKYAAETKGSEYNTVITLKNSFHGRTITTLAATGQDVFHELFQPLTPGFIHVEANNISDLEQALKTYKAACVIVECVQGEGGVIPLEENYLKQVRQITADQDVLLMVDEVQTGNGRTGKLYSYMHYGITPDIVSTAKGLGGGLPLGATLRGEKVKDTFTPGDHGSTFGGNPIACAGAYSILSRLTDEFLNQVDAKAKLFTDSLKDCPGIEAISGKGLMLGIKTTKPAGEVVNNCLEQGVMFLTAKEKVRALPALNIPDELLLKAAQILKESLK